MENIQKLKHIQKLYADQTFFTEYFGSICCTIGLILFLITVFVTVLVLTNIKQIKANWPAERCKPYILPFVSFINKPAADTDSYQFTEANFISCQQTTIKYFWQQMLQPLHTIFDAVTAVYLEIDAQINSLRTLISNIRTDITSVLTDILSAIELCIVPLQKMVLVFQDIMNKMTGVIVTSLFTTLGILELFENLMKIFVDSVILCLNILIVIIVCLFLGIFTIPIGIAGLVVFFSFKDPLEVIINFVENVLQMQPSYSMKPDPKPPNPNLTCFLGTTQTHCGKQIQDVRIGDEISKDCIVTGIFILENFNNEFYTLLNSSNHIIVTSLHKVKYGTKWVDVKDHPDFTKIDLKKDDVKVVYCLNTSTQSIPLDKYIFMDWDEGEYVDYEKHFNNDVIKEDDVVWGIAYLPLGKRYLFTKTQKHENTKTGKIKNKIK